MCGDGNAERWFNVHRDKRLNIKQCYSSPDNGAIVQGITGIIYEFFRELFSTGILLLRWRKIWISE